MTSQPTLHDFGSTGISNRRRAQAVEAKNGLFVVIVYGEERLRATEFVTLTRMAPQEFV